MPSEQSLNSDPGPPSSQKPSDATLFQLQVMAHVSAHKQPGGLGGGAGGNGGGGNAQLRGPQSVQSVPIEQELYSDPGPPSSQLKLDALLPEPSEYVHVSSHKQPGGLGGGAGGGQLRGPQSLQSVPMKQPLKSDPGPPSLQSPLDAQ